MTLYLILALTLTLSACVGVKRVYRLIDQNEEFIWTGSDNAKNYLLTIDSVDGIWFTGKIIIDSQDTLHLKGFEKGSNHPTTVRQFEKDTTGNTSLGHIFIWTKGFVADTVSVDNKNDSIKQLPLHLIFLKTRKLNQ